MPKKRRGRPPGSKNRPKATGSVVAMDVAQLSSHIDSLRKVLAAKIEQQRAFFQRQLAGLTGYSNSNWRRSGRSTGAHVGRPRAGMRKMPEAKYQSKKDKSLKWAGRGMTPVWMREEMKGRSLRRRISSSNS